MKSLDILEYAFSDFTSNKFKTMMSSLGIIIGVMAIVVMLTLGDGLQAGVSQQFGSLELDTMAVLPMSINMNGPPSATVQKAPAKLTDRDVSLIANTPGVKEVYPIISVNEQGQYKTDNRSLAIQAVVPQYETRLASSMDKGRFLTQSDIYSIVLGSKVANGTYPKVIQPGSYLTLSNPYTGKSQSYVVVGILKERNTSILTGDPNSAVYMTKAGLKGVSDQDTYSEIAIRADSVQDVDAVASRVSDALSTLHRNEAYTVLTQKMFADAISTIFNMIKYVLAGIGAVSLVVGGIGIMNVMTLTVKERVKEIGLMKAVGATTTDVRMVFLTESALLGLVSGVIGVAVAAVIALIVGHFVSLSMMVSPLNAVLGVGFGLLITTVFGVYPANQASRMDPIDALRSD